MIIENGIPHKNISIHDFPDAFSGKLRCRLKVTGEVSRGPFCIRIGDQDVIISIENKKIIFPGRGYAFHVAQEGIDGNVGYNDTVYIRHFLVNRHDINGAGISRGRNPARNNIISDIIRELCVNIIP